MGIMHAANVEKSPRLQAVLTMLRRRGSAGATGRELALAAEVLNPSGAVSELRANGFVIDCVEEPSTRKGRRVFRFVLRPDGQREMF